MTRAYIPLLAAALACALCLSGDSAADGGADGARDRAIGYDHVWHEGQVSVAGEPAVPCARCHQMTESGRLRGRPDHASCYGDCHGPAPGRRVPGRSYAVPEERSRQCRTCHRPGALRSAVSGGREALTVAYPPYRRDPDHGIHLSHAAHDQPAGDHAAGNQSAGDQDNDCGACHRGVGADRPAPADVHARCAACHGRAVDAVVGDPAGVPTSTGKMAPMTDCTACHEQVYGPRADPSIVPGTYPVTQTFSHQRHAARGQLVCRQCHASIATVDGPELAAPTMRSCATCHDGQQAFATTGPNCRRCHSARSDKLRLRTTALARFSHRDHKVESADCRGCHKLDARGVPMPTSADHRPCADAGCHRGQFSSLTPTICTTCHLGIEPWRPLHFDRPPVAATEFGARFSHRRHLKNAGVKRGCRDCHERADRNRFLRLPRDHGACQGAGCHADRAKDTDKDKDGGSPAPAMTECRECHAVGLLSGRDQSRLATQWSVRARFRHDRHERDPRTGARAVCTDCHRDVDAADTVNAIPTPSKATCQKCHDGRVAFKVTGHGCARCHGPASGDR